jgi:WD40 repeat protein
MVNTNSDTNVVAVFDPRSGQQLRTVTGDWGPDWSLDRLSTDGSLLEADQYIRENNTGHYKPFIVDVATGKVRQAPGVPQIGYYGFFLSPDGSRLVVKTQAQSSGSQSLYDRTLSVLEMATGTLLYTLSLGSFDAGSGVSTAFSADGSLLAVETGEGSVLLLDAATGRQTGVLKRETAMHVDGLAFSPDRSLLTAVLKDSTVVVWDVKAAQPVRTLEGFTDVVYMVAWSPDGRTLASIASDGGLILWRVAR